MKIISKEESIAILISAAVNKYKLLYIIPYLPSMTKLLSVMLQFFSC
jgi:hypothetical protein